MIRHIVISSMARRAALASCRELCHQALAAGDARFLHSGIQIHLYLFIPFARMRLVEMTLEGNVIKLSEICDYSFRGKGS